MKALQLFFHTFIPDYAQGCNKSGVTKQSTYSPVNISSDKVHSTEINATSYESHGDFD